MKSINEDIKNENFRQTYLLYGDEAYLKKLYKDKLKKAMLPEGDTMNYAYYEGKGTNPSELIDLAETMPFFADRRLIIVENSGFFKNATPELADYIKGMPETACFVFVEQEVDKRGKLYKAVKDKGRVTELGKQDEKTLLVWIAGMVKREGRQIKESTARYLISKVGTDMQNLEKEMEKLFSYTLGEAEITMQAIEEICTTQVTNKIFDMVESVATKQQKKLLLEVKALLAKGYDKSMIAKEAGLHPFVAGKYMKQCRSFSEKTLRDIMEYSAETEEMVKTGRLNDRMSVELFIVKYSK